MEFVPNWKNIGLKDQQQGVKAMLAALLNNRSQIIKCGLGSAWKVGENKHEAIPELAEAVFILGGQMFFLRERGFVDQSRVRV